MNSKKITKIIITIIITFFLPSKVLQAKTLIITHSCKYPEFIELQYKSFKTFLIDDYELVVFNDATSPQIKSKINTTCNQLGIKTITIPQEIHARPYLPREPYDDFNAANVRHANCIQYSLDTLGFSYNGYVCLIDSDVFLTRKFSISDYMRNKDIAAFIKYAPQNIYCLCPVLCIFDMPNLPDKHMLNFNCGRIKNWSVDSGGYTYFYLTQHPEISLTKINVLYSHQLFLADEHFHRVAESDSVLPVEVKKAFYTTFGFDKREINFLLKKPDTFEFYLDCNFIHYRGGSTDGKPLTQSYKFKIFKEFLNELTNS